MNILLLYLDYFLKLFMCINYVILWLELLFKTLQNLDICQKKTILNFFGPIVLGAPYATTLPILWQRAPATLKAHWERC
jgi:hypothetical protein